MSADDHAILIGIGRYPELGEGGTNADLKGPENDVEAVKAWLMEPKGGDFQHHTNIHVVTSSAATTAADAHPTADELESKLAEFDAIAQSNRRAGRGLQVGRRLYLFVSGHGFSPGRQRGCLFTANAKERLTFNVHVTGWLNWLQDAGYFREYVLWMDCCMNRMSFLQPRDPPLPPVNASEPPRANFVAFAAQRPLKAVEVPISEDGGNTHGVFTWALLEGLRGAAADANGRVTGRSLADWIRNAQSARMDPRDRDDVDVAKEPEVIHEDAGIIFARGVPRPLYPVRLSFPAAAITAIARLWSGTPPRVSQEFPVRGTPVTLDLQPGLYLIDVPSAGIRQGFEVVSPIDVLVEEQGGPVSTTSEGSVFQLDIDPGDPTAEIFVIDNRFSLVDGNPARLSTPLPFGLFKIKTRVGRTMKQRVILLDSDRPTIDRTAMAQRVATVIPIPVTTSDHEFHEEGKVAGSNALRALGLAGNRAALMVMARAFSSREAPVHGTRPWEGVSIVDSVGHTVIDLERDAERHLGGDPYAVCAKAVEPGSYFLRQRLADNTIVEQSLIVCESWGLEVYVLRRVVLGETVVDSRPRVSLMMRKLDEDPDFGMDQILETARVVLADERRILNADLEQLLLKKCYNPIAGIIGGHLLLVERERDPGRDLSLLSIVVEKLRSLVGNRHPDVIALALQCSDPKLRRVGKPIGPPMFQRSWKLLAQASQKRPALIPSSMWDRVQALSTIPPFLAWATNETIKSAARSDFARAILGTDEVQPRSIFLASFAPAAAPAEMMTAVESSTTSAARAAVDAAVGTMGLSSRIVRARAAQLQVPQSGLDALQAVYGGAEHISHTR